MYIRQISRRRKDGSRVRYLQLARKVRDPKTGIPRDEVLYHFGREDQLDREQLKRLVQSLSRFLGPGERSVIEAELAGLGREFRIERSLGYGGSYVLNALWRRLGIQEELRSLLRKRSYQVAIERILFALVANRALAPRSKLAVERWVGRKVMIDDLAKVSVQQLYRAMDFLLENQEEVQRAVFFSVASLLNLEVDLLFFDTTSSYFEVEQEDEEGLRRRGHSKDHRDELPQVVIGLAVTREGIPVRCWVLPGNTADASMVESVQGDLAGWKLNRVVWVMDRGMAGKDQRVALQRGGGHYILGEKLRSGERANQVALSTRGRYCKVCDNLEVKEVAVRHGSRVRRFVVVRNLDQAVRDRSKREALLQRLEEEIAHLNDGRRRRGAGHTKAVCALKTHPSLGRYVRELKDGQLRIDRAKVREEERLDGKYLLSTSDPSLTAEEVACGYKQLAEVERAFRTLKNTLELRPMYHRRSDRIRSHVLLCWLALLLVRVIEVETSQSWERVREELEEIFLVDLKSAQGTFRVCTTLTAEQRNLLSKLKISEPKRIRSASFSPTEV